MSSHAFTFEEAKAFERAKEYAKAAEAYCELGEYRKAEQLYRMLEQRFPFHKDIKFKLGRLFTLTERWEEAIIILQEIGNAGVYAEEALYLLAECFRQKGMIHAAKEMYADLLDRNYQYKDARQKLQMLEAPPGLSVLAAQQTAVFATGVSGSGGVNPAHDTIHGFAVEDRYTLLEELGRGGMGIVYKAEDTQTGGIVAIKVLPPYLASDEQNRLRFFREAELIARQRHPHIVTVIEVNDQENFLVMEYLAEGTLNVWKQRRAASGRQVLPYIAQILDALECVHQQGIVHRDLKPENILIADEKTAKLSDFGIAHICGATITHTGMHLGTIPYMSPEQILGTRVDLRSDIYAIGVILYELLTGTVPFTGPDISFHHVHTSPTPPCQHDPEIPAALNALILTCLAKNPDDRYASARALRSELVHHFGSTYT